MQASNNGSLESLKAFTELFFTKINVQNVQNHFNFDGI